MAKNRPNKRSIGAELSTATYMALAREAKRNRRSLNGEINLRLEATLEADKADKSGRVLQPAE